jgi:hypothetical protein
VHVAPWHGRFAMQSCYQMACEAMALLHGNAAPASNSPAREQLRAVCAAMYEAAHDRQAFGQAMRSWPGLAGLLAVLTLRFPSEEGKQGSDGAEQGAGQAPPPLGPLVSAPDQGRGMPLLLPAATRAVLASLLPPAQRVAWRLPFNSDVHGKSFASCFGRVADQGATFVVVRGRAAICAVAVDICGSHLRHVSRAPVELPEDEMLSSSWTLVISLAPGVRCAGAGQGRRGVWRLRGGRLACAGHVLRLADFVPVCAAARVRGALRVRRQW